MENTWSKTWHKYNKDPNVPSGTGKAFELSNFFYEEILSPKEPNWPQKVVTSGCEVITSGPEKCVKRGTPTFGIKVKLELTRKIFQTFD